LKLGHWGDLSAEDLKKEVENATMMLYKWLLKAKSCAVAPSKTTITSKKWILPGITLNNLLSMARGFAVHLHSRVMSYVARGSEKRAFSELQLFVRPRAISPKAITKGWRFGICLNSRYQQLQGGLTASASNVRE
jgi:hypothetical protein